MQIQIFVRLHTFFLLVPVLLSLIIGSELVEENEMNKIILNLYFLALISQYESNVTLIWSSRNELSKITTRGSITFQGVA